MEDLPIEVLLNIAGSTSTQDLCALSRVSKTFTSIAQALLYRSPSIVSSSMSHKPARSLISTLLRILINKPGLAKVVRSLELHPRARKVPFDYTILPDLSPDALRLLRIGNPELAETAVVGLILDRVPNLNRLVLDTAADGQEFRHKWDVSRYASYESPIQSIFGIHNDLETDFYRDISHIAGLKNLRYLNMVGNNLEWPWCQLPALQHLRVGRQCRLFEEGVPTSITSTVRTITMEVCTTMLDPTNPTQIAPVAKFLNNFTTLKKLTLLISDMNIQQASRNATPVITCLIKNRPMYTLDFRYFTDHCLSNFVDTLEHLCITIDDDEYCLPINYIWSIDPSEYAIFTKLRTLQVPLALITGEILWTKNDNDYDMDNEYATQLLPHRLEYLYITNIFSPEANIWQFLGSILHQRSEFLDLKEVRLSEYDHDFADHQWARLKAAGIRLVWDKEVYGERGEITVAESMAWWNASIGMDRPLFD